MEMRRQDPNQPEPNRPKPDISNPEIPNPSKSPITNPTSKPGIDRTGIEPEHDTRNIPDEMPPPIDLPEVDPEKIPPVDPNHPPVSGGGVGFY